MAVRATITVTMPVSEEGHRIRDLHKFANSAFDLHNIEALSKELELRTAAGEQRAVAIAKKAGLKPIGRPDLNYGLHGGKSGSIEMWFQISAEG